MLRARLTTAIFVALVAGAVVTSGQAPQPTALAKLQTAAESSDFRSTSTYDEVVKFMKAVDEASPIVFYTTYGTTAEGRAMPMAVVGTGLKDAGAASVRATGRLRVHIQADIHAGEVEGKESALILMRQLAMGEHADWLRSMVLLIAPIFNPDGNEKYSLTNRGRQNGPVNGMGTRQNGQNLNINRDFVKLDTPEARAFAAFWNDYDPQVGFDLHTSDGSFHAYHLTYAPPLNTDTSDAIMKIMKDEWFPFVTRYIKAKHGWDTFYYGNVPGPARGGADAGGAAPAPGPRAWASFEALPRYHNSYVGLRNRFGLLTEAYSYLTFEDRIKVTSYFLEEALDFGSEHADRLKKACAEADAESIVGRTLATRQRLKRDGMVQILMGEVEEEKNPENGAVMYRRKDVSRAEDMVDVMWFEPAATEVAAAQYYIPAEATKALDLLRAHGIQVRQLDRPASNVEQFVIASNTSRPVPPNSSDFGQHGVRTLEGSWQPAPQVTVPAGAWAVSLDQPLGRLAFYLLEPTSDDGLTTWNFLDEFLQGTTTYPILRKK
jgi:hypothetical protein